MACGGKQKDRAGNRRPADPIHHLHSRRASFSRGGFLPSCRDFLEVVLGRRT
jgi:hypothetical protein